MILSFIFIFQTYHIGIHIRAEHLKEKASYIDDDDPIEPTPALAPSRLQMRYQSVDTNSEDETQRSDDEDSQQGTETKD